MSNGILLRRQERVVTLAIDRPPLNVLDLETLGNLGQLLDDLNRDRSLQLLVIRGAGGEAFSAGVSVEDHTAEKVPEMLRLFHSALGTLLNLPVVTVAVVEGHCLGGGMELAAACDLVLAGESSTFGHPEIKLGCFPPFAAALYPQRLGTSATVELLAGGGTVTCSRAQEIGFVSRSAPDSKVDLALEELIADFTSYSRPVTRITMRAIRAARSAEFEPALHVCESLYLTELLATDDMHEGINAFLEKRSPVWTHR